jgi:hypothetical protein
MRLIVDANQADPIRFSYKRLPAKCRPTLVIPYRIWGELLIGSDADKRRRALAKFPLLYGMDMAAIFDELAQRSEDRIRSFVPIYRQGSLEHERLHKTFLHPTHDQVRLAYELKADGEMSRQRVSVNLPQLRKKQKDQANAAKSRGETLEYEEWRNIEDATHHLPRPIAAKSGDTMFDAVWDNPILRRFLRLQAMVCLGYAQNVWENPELNRTVKKKTDDVPDVSLTLYARDGDAILTADGIKERMKLADVEKRVEVMAWDAWLAAQTGGMLSALKA